jgi:glycerol-3-phosphate dehydrogenase
VAEHLIARYGSLVTEVLDLIREDKTLGQPLLDGSPYLRAEVAYAVTHEGALHAEDVLARRVRLLIETQDAGLSAAPEVTAIMAGLLGWNRRRRAAELRRYQDYATANAAALQVTAPELEASAKVAVPA